MDEIIRIAGRIENCYLVKGERPYLVDTLSPGGYRRLSAALRENGVDARDLAYLLITHYHYDHAGNLAELKRLSWAEVMAGSEDAPYIEGRKPPRAGSDINRMGRLLKRLPASLTTSYQSYAAAQVDVRLAGGETLEGPGLEALSLPGHTPGGICFLDRAARRAFVGDLVSNYFGRVGLPVLSASESLEEIEDSLRKLAALELEYMYPGHGRIIGPDASGLVAAFLRRRFG